MIKNSIISCDSLSGGTDSLEDVSHTDIFSDGSNVAVREGDICYVIIDGGPSYCYIARYTPSPSTDSYRTVAMVSGGTFVWQCQFIADLTETPEFPLEVKEVLGTVPAGFTSVAKGYGSETIFKSGDTPYRDYPLLAIYNNYLYVIGGESQYKYVYRIHLPTGESVRLTDLVNNVYYTAGCKISDTQYMIFDRYYSRAIEVNLSTGTNKEMATVIPGVLNQGYKGSAGFCNGKAYIFGGQNSGVSVYEYDRSLDDYTTPNSAAYVQKADLPVSIINAGTVGVGTKLYAFYRTGTTTGDIKGLIYDTVANTWDNTTIPDYSSDYEGYIKYHIYYDTALSLICIDQGNLNDPAMKHVVVGYDIATNTWSVVRSQPFELEVYDTSSVFDEDTDTTIHTLDSSPYVVRLYKEVKNLCVQDTP